MTAWRLNTDNLAQDLAQQAEIAESLGFHSFWLPESHFAGQASIPSPLMLLAGVASRTTTIGLGSTSYLLPIRHPIQAAEEVAVLDKMSGGRVILGVGRGVQKNMFKAFDIPEKEKRKRFKETLETMIKAWKGEPIAFEGSKYDGAENCGKPIHLAPLPIQKPHPRIWVAAFGPLAIKQAGNLGLPYLASPMETLESLEDNYSRHQQAISAAGHETVEVIPVMRTVFISDNTALVQQVKGSLVEEAKVRNTYTRQRESAIAADDWIDQAALVGSIQQTRDRLQEYREKLGITHLIARGRIPGLEEKDYRNSMALLMKLTTEH